MIKQGHIEIIDQKVIFVYYESEKPNVSDYTLGLNSVGYLMDCEIYEASKKSTEVSNEIEHISGDNAYVWFKFKTGSSLFEAKNNQPCKAEVTNNKAIIIKLN